MSMLSQARSRPVAQIITRRHPLAFALYSVVLGLGLIFVFQLFGAHQRQQDVFPDINPWVIFMWKWLMVSGGGGALLALCARPRMNPHWPDIADLLHLEGIAAVVAGFGVSTYAVGAVSETGFGDSYGALAFFIPIIIGHFYRGIQAIRQGRLLEELAARLDDEPGTLSMTDTED